MQYKIIQDYKTSRLEELVNNNIKNGWKPLGGIAVVYKQTGQEIIYVQSMIKE